MKIKHFVLLLLLLAFTRPLFAAPAPNPEWATWELSVDFVNQDINGNYLVSIGADVAGQPTVLHSETIALKCWSVGDVVLAGNHAAIDNGGHVQCKMPDFSQTVDAIITDKFGAQHVLNLPQSCNCNGSEKGPVTVQTKAELTKNGTHPIFEHPNFEFELNSNGKYIQHELSVNGVSGLSKWEFMPAGLHENKSEYGCTPAKCWFAHYLNGGMFDSEVVPQANLWFNGGETIVTIGKGMVGNLHHVIVDPGCYVG